jgi:hypothetical protein
MALGMSTTTMNSTTDVEKRLKTLHKKLKQIEELKQKSGSLDADAQKKVNSEQEIRKEIAMLESPCHVLESPCLEVLENLTQKSDNSDLSLLEDIEAALADVPNHAALLLGASEKRFRELQKSLRDLVKLLKMDKLDKLQQQKKQRLSNEAPDLLRAFLSMRSAAIELASKCGEAEIKALKAEREEAATERKAAAAAAVAPKLDVEMAPSPVTPPRIGIDVGGVLNRFLNDVNSDQEWEKMRESEAPGAMQALAKCVKYFGPENTFILSKCSGVMRSKTETWLFKTMNICGSNIGVKKKNVHFCADRYGPNGKGGVAASLELSHFVDDRDDCLWSVFEEGNSKAAVERHSGKFFHMARGAAGRYPPWPKEWSADERPACVTPVCNWSEVLQHLGIN